MPSTTPDPSTLFWLAPASAAFSEEIAAAPKSAAPGRELRRLGSARLNSSQLRRMKFAIAELDRAEDGRESLSEYRRVRIGFLGKGTLDFLTDLMCGSGPRHSLIIEVAQGGYDSLAGVAFGGDGGLQGRLDAVVLMLDEKALHPPAELLNRKAHRQAVDAANAYIEQLVDMVGRRFGCPIVLSTIVADPGEIVSPTDGYLHGAYLRFVAEMNDVIAGMAEAGKTVLWDTDHLAAAIGRRRWCDPVSRHVAKSPFAISLSPMIADNLCATLAGIFGKARRGLILDLDNTLWSGVIGDDGLTGINIGQGDAVGEAHLAVQRYALELRRRGIVLAVCSKNDDLIAREAFRNHPDMLLREDHVAVFQANWNDKATNIASIAKTLNLGRDAFVFLDDNPAERARVRQEFPEVAVPELPDDPSWFVTCLASAGYFETPRLNSEDLLRAKSYQDNARRAEIQSGVGNYEEYLASLDMTLTVAPFDVVGRARIAQLIGKSNQFNLTTRRYQEADVAAIESDPNAIGLQFRLADRFGDNGMICVVVLKRNATFMRIDTWLMSCRVLERGVEQAVLNEIVLQTKRAGLAVILGEYIPTNRNDMVRDHYRRLGFEAVELKNLEFYGDTPAGALWKFSAMSYPDRPAPMKVERVSS
jgi:FkbH-like protein